jgi:S-adenosylmethionine:tRNA-ribosyltransferase-isomerase (queuine synthetase)
MTLKLLSPLLFQRAELENENCNTIKLHIANKSYKLLKQDKCEEVLIKKESCNISNDKITILSK